MTNFDQFINLLANLNLIDSNGNKTNLELNSQALQNKILSWSPQDARQIIEILICGLFHIEVNDPNSCQKYLPIVLALLFCLSSHDNHSVYLAVEDRLNFLIKLFYTITSEILQEIKLQRNTKSIRTALRCFSALVPKIKPSKRRAYLKHILPILTSLVSSNEDSLLKDFEKSLPNIAINLFSYASFNEIESFFDCIFSRLNSSSVQRYFARILSICCLYNSNPAETFLHYLARLLEYLQNHAIFSTGNEIICSSNTIIGYMLALNFLIKSANHVFGSSSSSLLENYKNALGMTAISSLHFADLSLASSSFSSLCITSLEALREALRSPFFPSLTFICGNKLNLEYLLDQFYKMDNKNTFEIPQIETCEIKNSENSSLIEISENSQMIEQVPLMSSLPLSSISCGTVLPANIDLSNDFLDMTHSQIEYESDNLDTSETSQKQHEFRTGEQEIENESIIKIVEDSTSTGNREIISTFRKVIKENLINRPFDECLLHFIFDRFILTSNKFVKISVKSVASSSCSILINLINNGAMFINSNFTLEFEQFLTHSDPDLRAAFLNIYGLILKRFNQFELNILSEEDSELAFDAYKKILFLFQRVINEYTCASTIRGFIQSFSHFGPSLLNKSSVNKEYEPFAVSFLSLLGEHIIDFLRNSSEMVRKETFNLITNIDWCLVIRLEKSYKLFSLVEGLKLDQLILLELKKFIFDSSADLRDNALDLILSISQAGSSFNHNAHSCLINSCPSFLASKSLPSIIPGIISELDPVNFQPLYQIPIHNPETVLKHFQRLQEMLLSNASISNIDADKNALVSQIFNSKWKQMAIVNALNKFLGTGNVFRHSYLWHNSSGNFDRPTYSISCWHLLSIVNTSSSIACNLELHGEILNYLSGCSIRWNLESILNGLTLTGNVAMCLNMNNLSTKFTISLFHHLSKLLAICTTVILQIDTDLIILPTKWMNTDLTTAADVAVNLFTSALKKNTSGYNFNQLLANSLLTGGFGVGFSNLMESISDLFSVLKNPRSIGYFSDSQHYMEILKMAKKSHSVFKSSKDLIGKNDYFLKFLTKILSCLDRVLEIIRHNEVSSYVQELTLYLSVVFCWTPAQALTTSNRLLRTVFGTNLTSLWDNSISNVYTRTLNYLQMCYDPDYIPTYEINFDIKDYLNLTLQDRIPAMRKTCSLPGVYSEIKLDEKIRFFEPLVMHSLAVYGMSFSMELQGATLDLINQLIQLKINYIKLDSEGKFLETVLLQVESMDKILIGPVKFIDSLIITDDIMLYGDFGPRLKKNYQEIANFFLQSSFRFLQILTYEADDRRSSSGSFLVTPSQIFDLLKILNKIEGINKNSLLTKAFSPLIWDLFEKRLNSDNQPINQKLNSFLQTLRQQIHDFIVENLEKLSLEESFIDFYYPIAIYSNAIQKNRSILSHVCSFDNYEKKGQFRSPYEWLMQEHLFSMNALTIGQFSISIFCDDWRKFHINLEAEKKFVRNVERFTSKLQYQALMLHLLTVGNSIQILIEKLDSFINENILLLTDGLELYLQTFNATLIRMIEIIILRLNKLLINSRLDKIKCDGLEKFLMLLIETEHFFDKKSLKKFISFLFKSCQPSNLSTVISKSTFILNEYLPVMIQSNNSENINLILDTLNPKIIMETFEYFAKSKDSFLYLLYSANHPNLLNVLIPKISKLKNHSLTALFGLMKFLSHFVDQLENHNILMDFIKINCFQSTDIQSNFNRFVIRQEIEGLCIKILEKDHSNAERILLMIENSIYYLNLRKRCCEILNLKDDCDTLEDFFKASLTGSKRTIPSIRSPQTLARWFDHIFLLKHEHNNFDDIEKLLRTVYPEPSNSPHRIIRRFLLLQRILRLGFVTSNGYLPSRKITQVSKKSSLIQTGKPISIGFKMHPVFKSVKFLILWEVDEINKCVHCLENLTPISQIRVLDVLLVLIEFEQLNNCLDQINISTDDSYIHSIAILFRNLLPIMIKILETSTKFVLPNLIDAFLQLIFLALVNPRLMMINSSSSQNLIQDIVRYIKLVDQKYLLSTPITLSFWQESMLSSFNRINKTDKKSIEQTLGFLLTPRNPLPCSGSITSAFSFLSCNNLTISTLSNLHQKQRLNISNSNKSSQIYFLQQLLPTCQALKKSRLVLSLNAFTVPDRSRLPLTVSLNVILIYLCRLPEFIHSQRQQLGSIYDPFTNRQRPKFLTDLDRDQLAEVLCRFSTLGWTSTKMFEQTLTDYICLLNPVSDEAINQEGFPKDLDSKLELNKAERVEKNHRLQMTINAIGKLVMETCKKPFCGNPLLSYQPHKARLHSSCFKHSKLGNKLTQITETIEHDLSCLRYSNQPLSLRLINRVWSLCNGEFENKDEILDLSHLCFPDCKTDSDDFRARIMTQGLNFNSNLSSNLDISRYGSCNKFLGIQREPIDSIIHRLNRNFSKDLCYSLTNNRHKLQNDKDPFSDESVIINSCLASIRKILEAWMPTKPLTIPHRFEELEKASKSSVSLCVLTDAIKVLSLLFDSCNSRDQFQWIFTRLFEVMRLHISIQDVECPLHFWLGITISKCYAVLEIFDFSQTNFYASNDPLDKVPITNQEKLLKPILQKNMLEPIVEHCINCLSVSASKTIQCSGMFAAMNLLTIAVHLRQSQSPQILQMVSAHSPTGSEYLNKLLDIAQRYAGEQLKLILHTLCSVKPKPHDQQQVAMVTQNSDEPFPENQKKSSIFGLIRRSTQTKSTQPVINKKKNRKSDHPTQTSGYACVPNDEWYQLVLIEFTIFLIENFYSSPNSTFIPLEIPNHVRTGLTSNTEFLSQADYIVLVNQLVSILFDWHFLLLQDQPWFGLPPLTLNNDHSMIHNEYGRGTSWSLPVTINVYYAWTKAMEQIINSGQLPSHGIEALASMLTNRLRGTKSTLISLPLWSLFFTCLYKSTSISLENSKKKIRTHESSVSLDMSYSELIPSQPTMEIVSMEAFAQEQITNIWQRIQGNIIYSIGSGRPPWPMPIGYTELHLLSRIVPGISLDLMQWALKMSGLNTVSYSLDKIAHLISDNLLNRALNELARSDHKHPSLALIVLNEFFAQFLIHGQCRNQIANWLTLSLPTILSRSDTKRSGVELAVLACLSASNHPNSELLFLTCLDFTPQERRFLWTYVYSSIDRGLSAFEKFILDALQVLSEKFEETPFLDGILCSDVNPNVRRDMLALLNSSVHQSQLLQHFHKRLADSMHAQDQKLNDPLG